MNSEKNIIEHHKSDAQKTLKHLATAKNNTDKSSKDWDDIVKTRKEHCEAFIASLEVQEKQFEHFK